MGCHTEKNAPLKAYTTFQVGGPCTGLIHINNAESCRLLKRVCREEEIPFLVLGKGSNLIVDDKGYDGVVFLMGNDFSGVEILEDALLICDAGTTLAAACLYAYEHSLTGLEFAWGIPGTVGGAVYMNAGAYGGEIRDVLATAEYLDEEGGICVLPNEELDFSYRHSLFTDSGKIILRAAFRLKKGDPQAIKAQMDDLMRRRKDKQPLEYPSAGSTFKRPEGSYASLLIEQCGLKGFSVGGAQVSQKHSGFVINTGNATFNDIMALIQEVKKIVKEKTGYALECEPKVISNRD